jgi:hypothetical protein
MPRKLNNWTTSSAPRHCRCPTAQSRSPADCLRCRCCTALPSKLAQPQALLLQVFLQTAVVHHPPLLVCCRLLLQQAAELHLPGQPRPQRLRWCQHSRCADAAAGLNRLQVLLQCESGCPASQGGQQGWMRLLQEPPAPGAVPLPSGCHLLMAGQLRSKHLQLPPALVQRLHPPCLRIPPGQAALLSWVQQGHLAQVQSSRKMSQPLLRPLLLMSLLPDARGTAWLLADAAVPRSLQGPASKHPLVYIAMHAQPPNTGMTVQSQSTYRFEDIAAAHVTPGS